MLQKLFFASQETVTEAGELVTTEYTNLKVPMGTLVFLVIGMVLLLAVVIAGFILIKRHCVNWGFAIMSGAAAFMLFSYIVYNAVFIGLGLIPGVREQLSGSGTLILILFLVFCTICDFLTVFLGMKYVANTNAKRDMYYDLGTPAIFALAIFTVSILLEIPNSLTSAPLSGFFNFFTLFTTVNTVGFDPFVTNLVQNGVNQAEIVEQLAGYMTQSLWSYVFEVVFAISRLAFFLCSTVLMYGVIREKLEKKYIGLMAALIFISLLPKELAYHGLNIIICMALSIVLAAAAFYYTLRIVKEKMPEELDRVSRKIDNSSSSRRRGGQDRNKPMPKIVMPKD